MKHKKLIISLTAVLSVLLFLATFVFVWYVCDYYPDFKEFRKEFEIPGLDEGAVPQGMGTTNVKYEVKQEDGTSKSENRQFFFVSAYMTDGSPSRIYVIGEKKSDEQTSAYAGYIGYVTMKLKNADGNYVDFYGHCGGVALNENTLWVASDRTVYVAKASEEYKSKNISREILEKAIISRNPVVNNEDGTTETKDFSISFTASFDANCNASFLYLYDDSRYTSTTYDRLYVGEFYRKGNYETDLSHRLVTPNGYKNNAFMYEYNISTSSDNKYGLITLDDKGLDDDNKVPEIKKIFSLPEKIQGAAFSGREGYGTNDGMIVLSQSYGLSNSRLLCFDWKKVNESANGVLYSKLSVDGKGLGKVATEGNKDEEGIKDEDIKDNERPRGSFVYNNVYKTVGGQKMPFTDSALRVYYVDINNEDMFVSDYSVPSMSEGLCVITRPGANPAPKMRVYVLFESASKKYNKFVRERLHNVYSFIPHVK